MHRPTQDQKVADIEVICGPMFSGKTEELVSRLERLMYADLNFLSFCHEDDSRYDKEEIVSHNGKSIDTTPVEDVKEIESAVKKFQQENDELVAVGIDEFQFFGEEIVDLAVRLFENERVRVILAGLDRDYKNDAFPGVPQLLRQAHYVHKLQAVCQKCGCNASYSQRLSGETDQIIPGDEEKYEARCYEHFSPSE
ncbi:MAG: thymidine kinase [Candidatus Magasanikbacteria bacterium]